jgi:hypothetical protein
MATIGPFTVFGGVMRNNSEKATRKSRTVPRENRERLLTSDIPRVRYLAARLFEPGSEDPKALSEDPLIRDTVGSLSDWDDEVLKQHNKPGLGMHRLALLADLGVNVGTPGLEEPLKPVLEAIRRGMNEEGIPRIKVLLPKVFRGSGEVETAWIICDYPQILYGYLMIADGTSGRSTSSEPPFAGSPQRPPHPGLVSLCGLARENGVPCVSSLPGFRGPGPKSDFCPIASLYLLKALNLHPETRSSEAARLAAESLLNHWAERGRKKHYMFGIGTDFGKLKFPLVWYNLLHVLDVLSRSAIDKNDPRLLEMGELLLSKSDESLRFVPESMYRLYKDYDFADKKNPSSTMTVVALAVLERLGLIAP